jgi:hypothetical protein
MKGGVSAQQEGNLGSPKDITVSYHFAPY